MVQLKNNSISDDWALIFTNANTAFLQFWNRKVQLWAINWYKLDPLYHILSVFSTQNWFEK